MSTIICQRPSSPSSALQQSDLPVLLQRIYASRGVEQLEELELQLAKLPQPTLLKGIEQAVERLWHALQKQERVLIVGDFDADGATSTTVAMQALQAMGLHHIDFLVPNRFEYGYGLTPEIVEVAASASDKPDLLITVDNGISSVQGVARARELGMDVLVTDHHLPGDEIPAAVAIVNPNQPGCEFPSKNLAGVGVIFYVMLALRKHLRDVQWFTDQSIPEPNLGSLLDLVALGTIADVVTLDHPNRILVQQGLARIRAGQSRPGIQALLNVAGRPCDKISSVDLGFVLGPRLNAAGRLDDMSLGIDCLMAPNEGHAAELATQLDDLNRDRKSIEQSMQKQALNTLSQINLDEHEMPWGLSLYQADWHQGVIGILASRIKDKYHRPVIMFADEDSDAGTIKGSARSIAGLHIRDALDTVAARNPGLLNKFGGHAMAAGMSLDKNRFEDFQKAFDDVVREQLNSDDLQAKIISDGALSHSELSMPVAEMLQAAGPWGQNFPEPSFDGEFYLVNQRIVGDRHLKFTVSLEAGGQQLIDAIAFNVDTDQWPNYRAERLHLSFKLDVNEFRGRRSLQLLVNHIEVL
ncbi:single-stranded-DNA-specific exonuclease RecJ [Pseudoteredinibacter isoporae]|uniref:Single-stranded-DNA-specific exonuclease RecJ n=1 Tax=Pseudoteredinibacter isoporae TaxID=570281 RepID=A0A7X0MW85_9GAMM|nr:single-stranded-DNA-specific exonuclease RecJ [Pseudoteredinibacter isoporae]MBB6522198.1 single-stranded-DNA-specific exonuclease [Pseudoteredinibacter isoporae]NHO87732.1 single-stranded-DNA-specific exonuclease RecJ [Pseudoteredinibacter isoporae]NIB23937.1 single-stranded-DNA-specific exonuclease RecJ [Pseudoteredinibacter isoporae]